MAKGKRRSFSPEFKLSAVNMYLGKIHKTGEICKIYDIDRQTLHRWVQEYKTGGYEALISHSVLPGTEVEKLKSREELEMENEILKKAIAYFARQEHEE